MKIYISGPITGRVIEEATEEFARAEEAIRAAGHDPVNPLKNGLDPTAEWIEHMEADLCMLRDCDAIVMLPGWVASNGCRIEVSVAALLRILIVTSLRSLPMIIEAPKIEGIS